MNKTGIEWADYTWNPVTGCSPVSECCTNCYAARIAKRFWKGREFSEVQFHPERLKEVEKFPKNALVFVGSMTDMFHPENCGPNENISLIGRAMQSRPDLNFVMLTKRPENIHPKGFMNNLMVGVSVENASHLGRIETLRKNYKGPKCISFEPLLGPIPDGVNLLDEIDWVIAGQETGTGARPAEHKWFHELENICASEGIPYFEKKVPCGDPHRRWPKGFRALKGGE